MYIVCRRPLELARLGKYHLDKLLPLCVFVNIFNGKSPERGRGRRRRKIVRAFVSMQRDRKISLLAFLCERVFCRIDIYQER